MSELKRIILTPFFGNLPEWFDKFEPPKGYNWLLDTDLEKFKQRVSDILHMKCPIIEGTGKVWDYRCALGLLYKKEIAGYDYWATMDFDMVFGRVNEWFTDAQLRELDVWSNHDTYVCGCWSLYKNSPIVNGLFMWEQSWKEYLNEPEANGWVEGRYSRLLEASGLKYKYSFFQGDPYNPPFNVRKEGDKLFQNNIEIPMLHFRRSKIYPL